MLGSAIAVLAIVGVVAAVTIQDSGDHGDSGAPCGDPVRPIVSAASFDPAPRSSGGQPTFASIGGVAAGGYMLGCESETTMARDLDVVAASGATWVRFDFDWGGAEPAEGSFTWDTIDRVVAGARQRHLDVLATLAYTPRWARPPGTTDKTPPSDPATFARFAAEAAARYAPQGVHAWEIWNEPNIHEFWKPRPDVAAYARLLAGAAAAIRRHDPRATIITAGLAPAADTDDGTFVSPRTFLAGLYAAGVRSSFDAVGIHPYDYPYGAAAEGDWNQFWSLPKTFQVMADHGDGAKKLWGTEYGAPTGTSPQAVSPSGQAAFVQEGFSLWAAKPFTGPLFWYAHRDNGIDPRDPGANFGLVASNFTPKPAFAAFRELMAKPLPPPGGAVPGEP